MVVPLGGGRAGQEDEGGGDEAGETKLHGDTLSECHGAIIAAAP
ncbi:hypothetical protein QO012_004147 [Methylobacterium aerolatum]|uniref:Uncharacterized protein n=1 Tax=Methylobacterium aerolatum TaxID=418708 RepID=A0ABU0I4U4_9HYPH|nr:hypothetical protein [Methylobacterium aerolatum]